jgi:hypothetical protein
MSSAPAHQNRERKLSGPEAIRFSAVEDTSVILLPIWSIAAVAESEGWVYLMTAAQPHCVFDYLRPA